MRSPATATLGFVILGVLVGCHQAKTPQATMRDVEAARKDAQHEVEQARLEASKDVKSAAKIMGPNSRNVAAARVTGAYDLAMARADGDHRVALESCMTLPDVSAQLSCKHQADLAYETAATTAKAIRVSRQQ